MFHFEQDSKYPNYLEHGFDNVILNVHHVNVCVLWATTNVLLAADMYHNYGQ